MLIAPPPPPVSIERIVRAVDVECYRNYFLIKLRDRATRLMWSFRMDARHSINWPALHALLAQGVNVTFNGNGYDVLMMSAAATGRFNNDMLKNLSDHIFASKFSKAWQIADEIGVRLLQFDHIDLMPIAPGDGGLKQYMGRLHCEKLQDLPYPPDKVLTWEEMEEVDEYCGNDLIGNIELYDALLEDIETRIELTEQYGVDMRSKSDAQIAEAAFKSILGLNYQQARQLNQQAQKPPMFTWRYQPPPFIRFATREMQEAFARVTNTVFSLSETGQVIAPLLDKYEFGFDGAVYRMGVGGLHSSESCAAHRAGPDCVLTDFDVASYYPMIIKLLRLFPAHLGHKVLEIYCGMIDVRLAHKAAKRKRKANTYKIILNGFFGKTKERHALMFDPVMFIQIVITGQLALLMMIERQYLIGVHAVNANTDGVVLKCHPSQVDARNAVVRQWEADTGFTMEDTNYAALMSRDVNSYMAFKPAYTDKDGVYHPIEVKTKGEYADDPLSRLAKNPANSICLDAIKAYIISGTPLEQTIRRCDDIRKFVTVRNVSGGGSWVKQTVDATRVADKRALLESRLWVMNPTTKLWSDCFNNGKDLKLDDAFKAMRMSIPREPIGKTVRWYYGAGQVGHIATPKGGMVAKSQGAKPCMQLPKVLPPDIDYAWYIAEAQSMLQDLGVA